IFYAISGNGNNLITCLPSTPSLTTPNTINTVTSTYANSIADQTYTKAYINNIEAVIGMRFGGNPLNTQANGYIRIGEALNGSTFHSVRLYNRVLNRAEIEHNAALDQKRYLATPIVMIGTQQCLNVAVHSSRLITCELPAGGTSGTTVDVEITKTDGTLILKLEDEFTYE
ncbi:MAG: LamG domain-containing protein, partial [Prevotellaceae bacterium]|nr:LamG domain-containing protein [Prevotellaceae bacterium]